LFIPAAIKNEMHKISDFLIKIGALKEMKRRGWILRGVKNPESIADHTFRMAIAAWLLASEKGLNINRVIKMALVHDLCEVYAGDSTPYDHFLPKSKSEFKKILAIWPRLSKTEKQRRFSKKYSRENASLDKLIVNLPIRLKREIKSLWLDYEQGLTKEGRFVRQIDRLENLLQALEYCQKDNKFPINSWWVQIEELVDDSDLIDFMVSLGKTFSRRKKNRKK
jgi:putative hydrolase of HD superfamily